MTVLTRIAGWFRRKKAEKPLERPRDLPPRRADGSYPHEGPYPSSGDQTIGWRH